MSPIYEPLPVPERADATPLLDLQEKELALFETVLTHFSAEDYTLEGEIRDEEKMWLSYECMLRYLRATKWDSNEAIKRLEGTLKWRRDFGLYDVVTPELVEPEAVTGKEFLFGYDTRGRPAQYMCPSKQNTEEGPRQIQYTVWMLERAVDMMGPGVETLALMINYADKAKNPSLGTARTVLNILQTHYPERLGLALILNVPWMLQAFYKLITPFIDPVTRAKMRFNPVTTEDGMFSTAAGASGTDEEKAAERIFEPRQLVKQWWGGAMEYEYDHEKYWPKLVELCDKRRNGMMEAWRKLGGKVGLKEWDMKNMLREHQT
ncbi:CRAL TRIO domain-containing protein [Hygrophoropsis aurantiaca]|uniref:CRAL TRIO domain-containing protein n=1 Tax=Hygrophoropsis aurantiaca TaxID=72124 RepID=A0ACB8AEE3_9AGAM|nr:CRAL TRIO domain-containing protein [Hygrophoropsis aurantiaca]